MKITITSVSDAPAIKLNGRLDLKGTQEVEAEFNKNASESGKSVIVDLSEVNYIASIGIRMFLSNIKKMSPMGTKMVIFRPQKMVEEIFKLAGVDSIIPIEHDEDAAAEIVRNAS